MQITIDTQKDSKEEIIEAINFLGQLVNPGVAPAPATSGTPTVDQLLADDQATDSLPGVATEESKPAAALENEEIIPY